MKSKYTLLVVLFMIVVLLVVDHFLFASSNSSPENKEKVTVTPTANSLSRLSNTENNIHLFLIFNNSKLQNPDVLVGNIQYLWGPSHNKPINPSIYTSAYVP